MVIIMKKRKKLNKKIRFIISICLVIIISYITITVTKNIDNKESSINKVFLSSMNKVYLDNNTNERKEVCLWKR